jgi:hypothetical protein
MVLPWGRAAASSWPLADRVLAFFRTAAWRQGAAWMQDVVEFLVYQSYSWQGGGLRNRRRRWMQVL